VSELYCEVDGSFPNHHPDPSHPENLRDVIAALAAGKGEIGFAFDGDGDRLISVDETGQIRDGDYALAICGRHLAARGQLKGGTVVTTVMANLALDRTLTKAGIGLAKVSVGDRYVLEEMLRTGANLGGEQSGHLLFLDHATTGDGIVSALQVLTATRETGRTLAELTADLAMYPQVLLNVEVPKGFDWKKHQAIADAQSRAERSLNGRGRVLLRPSGTEPVLRVMVEGEPREAIESAAKSIADTVRKAALA